MSRKGAQLAGLCADVDALLKYCSNNGQNQIIQHTFRNVSYLEVRFCVSTITALEEQEIWTYHMMNGSAIAWIAAPLKEACTLWPWPRPQKPAFKSMAPKLKGVSWAFRSSLLLCPPHIRVSSVLSFPKQAQHRTHMVRSSFWLSHCRIINCLFWSSDLSSRSKDL